MASNNNVQFVPVQSGQAPNIVLTFGTTSGNVAGGITTPSRDEDGFVTGFGVIVTDDTNKIDSCEGLKKVVMHEIGHGQGEMDADGTGGSSVMNQFAGKNDVGGNLPTSPTPCDSAVANQGSTDTGIICWTSPHYPPPCDYNDYTDGNGCCIRPGSPIIVSLDSANIKLTGPEVLFDLAGNGRPAVYAWTEPGAHDAFLVLDRNSDGKITDGQEMFGNFTPQPLIRNPNGFNALSVFDQPANGGNLNGVLTSADSIFSRLQLWIDTNHDGVSQPNELSSLSSAGIAQIDLTYQESRRRDGHGNEFRYRSRIAFANGETRWAWDVFLVRQGGGR